VQEFKMDFTFEGCIDAKVEAKLLNKAQATRLKNKYNELLKKYQERGKLTSVDDMKAAAAQVVETEMGIIIKKRINLYKTVKSIPAQKKRIDDLVKFIDKQKGKADPESYIEATNMYLQQVSDSMEATSFEFTANLDEFVAAIRNNDVDMHEVVRGLYGENIRPEAQPAVEAMKQALEYAHTEYGNAGGIMGKIDSFFPMAWDKDLVGKVDFEQWWTELKPKLATDKMIDFETGAPFDPKALDGMAEQVYEDIASGGVSKALRQSKKLMSGEQDIDTRKNASRFFVWKSASDQLEANATYGRGDGALFDMAANYLESMGKDTGLLRSMGPNPNKVFKNVEKYASVKSGRAGTPPERLEGQFRLLTGAADEHEGDSVWFNLFQASQSLFRGAMLSTASVRALGDSMYVAMAAASDGLEGGTALKEWSKMLVNQSDLKDIAREGQAMMMMMQHRSNSAARFYGEVDGGGSFADIFRSGTTTQKVRKAASYTNSVTMRLGGLNYVTNNGKDASTAVWGVGLANRLKKSFEDLPTEFKDALGRYGLTEQDFSLVQRASKYNTEMSNGMEFFRPDQVLRLADELAKELGDDFKPSELERIYTALSSWHINMRNKGVNEQLLMTRYITTGGANRPAGFVREGFQATLQFMSFPISQYMNFLRPAWRQAMKGKVGGLATLAIAGAFNGVINNMLVDTVNGKTIEKPEDIEGTAKMITRGLLASGSLSFFGDWLLTEPDPYRGTKVGGPLVGAAADIISNGWKAAGAYKDGDIDEMQGHLMKGFTQTAAKVTPQTWYTKMVFKRMILDQMNQAADPNYERSIRAHNKNLEKRTGQEYWWSPAEAPDVEEFLGQFGD
jgi:hypothetical protein